MLTVINHFNKETTVEEQLKFVFKDKLFKNDILYDRLNLFYFKLHIDLCRKEKNKF